MRKTVIIFAVSLVLALICLPLQVRANFDFSTSTQSISDTDELAADITIDLSSSAANKNYYLRAAFYKSGTTQYFGYTQNNNGDFYKGPYTGNNCANLYKITTDSQWNWQGTVNAKVDPEDSAFKGTDNYLFKVGRYTESCSLTWADTEPVQLTITQTVLPTPSPTAPTSTKSSISTSSSAFPKQPSPSPSKFTSKTTQPSNIPSNKPLQNPAVLGESSVTDSPKPVNKVEFSVPSTSSPVTSQPTRQKVAAILVGAGAILIGLSIFSLLWYKRNQDRQNKNKEKDNFDNDNQE